MTSDSMTATMVAPALSSAPHVPVNLPLLISEELFQGQREVLIQHAGELYRLRLTRNGKLILNK